MKRIVAAVSVAAILALSGVARADDITLENSSDIVNMNTATANSSSAASATGGNVDFENSYVVPVQPYNVNAPAPIQSGPALTIGEWGLWVTTLFTTVSYEQALSLSDNYYGFFVSNRIGDEAIMMKGLKPTTSVTLVKYWGRGPGDEYVASFPVYGKKRDQLEGLIGLASKRAMELGATKVGIMLRTIKEINTKGLSMGTGAGVGLYVPCNSGVGTGLNFGAYISNTKTEDMYELNVICLRGGAVEIAAPPQDIKPEPKTPCDMAEINKRIREREKLIEDCDYFSHNNFSLRVPNAEDYLRKWVCSGYKDEASLAKGIFNLEIAERNYLYGRDIKDYADSEDLIKRANRWLASAIYARDGKVDAYYKHYKPFHKGAKGKWERKMVLKQRENLERFYKKIVIH